MACSQGQPHPSVLLRQDNVISRHYREIQLQTSGVQLCCYDRFKRDDFLASLKLFSFLFLYFLESPKHTSPSKNYTQIEKLSCTKIFYCHLGFNFISSVAMGTVTVQWLLYLVILLLFSESLGVWHYKLGTANGLVTVCFVPLHLYKQAQQAPSWRPT